MAAFGCDNIESRGLLFSACNQISAMRYEGGESAGTMIVAQPEHEDVELTVRLKTPVPFENGRAVRKLLETTSKGISLVCDSRAVHGLGRQRGRYNFRDQNLYVVRFMRHYEWEFCHNDDVLMQVQYGQPKLPQPKLDAQKLERDVARMFANVRGVDAIGIRARCHRGRKAAARNDDCRFGRRGAAEGAAIGESVHTDRAAGAGGCGD